jgi:large repetitive protein
MFGATSGTTYRIRVGGYGATWAPSRSSGDDRLCSAPDVHLVAQGPRQEVSADFSATEKVAGTVTFECSLDGGAFTACTSPFSYTAPGRGTHTLEVQAMDAASNVDPSPVTFTFETHGRPVP